MTVGIDTNRIHSETYAEYSKQGHVCSSYQQFLLVEIMRLKKRVLDLLEYREMLEADIEEIAGGGY